MYDNHKTRNTISGGSGNYSLSMVHRSSFDYLFEWHWLDYMEVRVSTPLLICIPLPPFFDLKYMYAFTLLETYFFFPISHLK